LAGTVPSVSSFIFVHAGGPPSTWRMDGRTILANAVQDALGRAGKVGVRVCLCYGGLERCVDDEGSIMVLPELMSTPPLDLEDASALVHSVYFERSGKGKQGIKPLNGRFYIFVDSHGPPSTLCGACGPPVLEAFAAAIVNDKEGDSPIFSVFSCSHLVDSRYAPNVLVFGRTLDCGGIAADWYGFVSPADVPELLAELRANRILERLWRGGASSGGGGEMGAFEAVAQ